MGLHVACALSPGRRAFGPGLLELNAEAPIIVQPKAPVPPPPPPPPSDEGAAAWARRAAALSLLGLTGAVAASAFSDLSVFLSCSSQAMEKATKNQQVASAIGEPITRGPWYSASIAVNRARRSVSCTFPVSGPQGDGLLKFKAVRLAEESWFRFLQPSDWEILIMDAILDVRTEDGKHQTMRVTVADNTAAPPPPADCRTCKPRPDRRLKHDELAVVAMEPSVLLAHGHVRLNRARAIIDQGDRFHRRRHGRTWRKFPI
ncbi:hypothetical protein TRIUR3_00562 [Triticum urartu]|uniref:Uncharacterized protein n=1 Tax=Triticum urartu TaxID=4572 RepID=M7ZUZ7_TRIUA|nr:hypothetical protein TRIUR3_00562 [Triticum urartu]